MAPRNLSEHRRFYADARHQDYRFRLWRLYDDEFVPLRHRSQALWEDAFEFALMQQSSELGLAELFVGLSDLMGESGRYFDNYKGSFSFPLLLILEQGERRGLYVLNLHDWRGTLELEPSRILLGEARRQVARPGIVVVDPLFGNHPMSWLQGYLLGRVEGHFENTCQDYCTPFYQVVESNWIVYGYRAGRGFFSRRFEDSESFREMLDCCKREMEDVDGDRLAIMYRVTGDACFNDLDGMELYCRDLAED